MADKNGLFKLLDGEQTELDKDISDVINETDGLHSADLIVLLLVQILRNLRGGDDGAH